MRAGEISFGPRPLMLCSWRGGVGHAQKRRLVQQEWNLMIVWTCSTRTADMARVNPFRTGHATSQLREIWLPATFELEQWPYSMRQTIRSKSIVHGVHQDGDWPEPSLQPKS